MDKQEKEYALEVWYDTRFDDTRFEKARKISIEALESVAIHTKTGHWIWQTEDIYQCSECGEDLHVKEVMNKPQYICCPICGCPMEIER